MAEVVLAALLDEVPVLDDGRAPLRSRLEDLRVAHCVYSVYEKLESKPRRGGGWQRKVANVTEALLYWDGFNRVAVARYRATRRRPGPIAYIRLQFLVLRRFRV